MFVKRSINNPLIRPHMDPIMGGNISGPTVIRVPEWVKDPLGKYYLYFAHHFGRYIRLAYADTITGPYTMYTPGTLRLENSFFTEHIASPDVHVDNDSKKIVMYYHGGYGGEQPQVTRLAVSGNGLEFSAMEPVLGPFYFRVFQWGGYYYAFANRGRCFRSRNNHSLFEQGPTLVTSAMRHCAVFVREDKLYIFYSKFGDKPEHIRMSVVNLSDDWNQWTWSESRSVIFPEEDYETGGKPAEVSMTPGGVYEPVNQLRDPYFFTENGNNYLFYCVAGESGIAVAELPTDLFLGQATEHFSQALQQSNLVI